MNQIPQTVLTNPLKPTIELCKIPAVITETLIVCKPAFDDFLTKVCQVKRVATAGNSREKKGKLFE